MAAYTAGFMTHVTCRLSAKNRDQLWKQRSVIEYGLSLQLSAIIMSLHMTAVMAILGNIATRSMRCGLLLPL